MKNWLKNMGVAILDALFPHRCLGCGKKGSLVCTPCLAGLYPPERTCPNFIYPAFDYRHPLVRKIVWALKYQNRKSLAKLMAELMSGNLAEELAELELFENFGQPILVPIPISKSRLRERGYNQSELIAKNLSGFVVETKILIKIKDTPRQARIENRQTRMQNVLGSFAVQNAELIQNRNIILIDDVATTGATLKEARKVLKNAGARKIIAFTFAH